MSKTSLAVKLEQTNVRTFAAAQDHAAETTRVVGGMPMAFGVLIGPIEFGAGDTRAVQTKLGRDHVGWMVVRAIAASGQYPVFAERSSTVGVVALQASAACRVWFWVF